MKTRTSSPIPLIDEKIVEKVAAIAREGIDLNAPVRDFPSNPLWESLKAIGTELWLDTGDIDGALRQWTREFSGITVNNTLLNAEVQKGIYDETIRSANSALPDLDLQTRLTEIAFILNARHGLRLVQKFGAHYVSVELHTSLANDIEGTLAYARRYHEICPDRFLVKIPLTPAGLIAARQLHEEKIAINLTLGFSARHNYIPAAFAQPAFVNVFLGRLNSYIESNRLGSGRIVGEKATVASQMAVKEANGEFKGSSRQIAASIRNAGQIASLAGIDVDTMPLSAAQEATAKLNGGWTHFSEQEYPIEPLSGIEPERVKIYNLWEVRDPVYEFTEKIIHDQPQDEEEFMGRAAEAGIADLFPSFTVEDRRQLMDEGKIPRHNFWVGRIEQETLALDSLLNAAGLASFGTDQQQLDNRIRKLITG